ncbi:alpha-D-glucose phosphate-specific phosphoglucomutase [Falsigemmobacter faecalis]|uniref:phosphoglucomutase (alpha-D-glucose-1,6-bisphosphate-dependent) n=1 Tax=Falsigemmobacter faecalis TaxID=2488730 RepID=A0A3P3D7X6_9RHOB|nr:alpha-D-glucose phosphate-specific phosphoglucomutase [Falsigemmobacter faecalis]RRH70281.1 alpha-D-glucose phosphate-specific phosphoglucomutase [Falsigemmobacter faecalis]
MTGIFITAGPFDGQKPGTSGLRKKTAQFSAPHYLECFVQATLSAVGAKGKTLVLGGDGRAFGAEAAAIILRMAAANGVARVIVGRNALLSTPAASHLIRLHGADGGIILSASHNPGGMDGDFGVKYNIANGGPAPEGVTAAIHAETLRLSGYHITATPAPDLSQDGSYSLDAMAVEVVDPVSDYAALMESLFDFPAIRAMFARGFRMKFDAMCAVTGPYATEILERRLGAAAGSVMHGTPLPDFGGMHPDPNPTWAADLYGQLMAPDAPDFGAASDGDGDRNMVVGRGIYVNPSDSLAVLAANAHLAPGYAGGLKGIARSMPTSTAADRVAAALGIEAHETPTGWKFFGNLLDAGRVTICGEESFGTGSDHVREKDGLWAVLLWLNILAATGRSVAELMQDHWQKFGRTFYSRHDFEALPVASAEAVMTALRDRLATLPGTLVGNTQVTLADDFAYHDPVDGSESRNQGLRVVFANGARFVLRLSGTGTEGATLRLYLEQHSDTPADFARDPQEALSAVIAAAEGLAQISGITGRVAPDVVT